LYSQSAFSKPKIDVLSNGAEILSKLLQEMWYLLTLGQNVGISHEKLKY
jgi:hypothetical protein